MHGVKRAAPPRPFRLFGFAAVIRTGTMLPDPLRLAREVHDRVAARPARQLPVAAPAARVDQHVDDRADRLLGAAPPESPAAAPAAPRSAASSPPPPRRPASA